MIVREAERARELLEEASRVLSDHGFHPLVEKIVELLEEIREREHQEEEERESLRLDMKRLFGDALHDEDPNCDHDIYSPLGGGVKCRRCSGWFCN